jgi:hypothetical protein
MPKDAVSVTLDRDNLLWLRGQLRALHARSLSDVLDRVVAAARTGRAGSGTVRSVKGSVHIAADDPSLQEADAVIRRLFARPRAARRPPPPRRGRVAAPGR